MRVKDYVRLGRLSIRSRKKSTRNTVLGISFGLSLLIAVVFFTLAFSLDLTRSINEARNVTCFAVPTVHELETMDGSYELDESSGIIHSKILGKTEREALFAQVGETAEEIVSQEYLSLSSTRTYLLNGETFRTEWQEDRTIHDDGTVIKVLREQNGSSVPSGILSDLKRLNKSFLAAGTGFSGDSKGEILISERLVRINGKTPEEVIGQPLSLQVHAYNMNSDVFPKDFDNDNDPDNVYVPPANPADAERDAVLFQNFRIAGVISDAYYALNDLLAEDAHIWIAGASYYGEDPTLPKYQPVLRLHTNEYGETFGVATYPEGFEAMQQAALGDGMFFAAHPAVDFHNTYGATRNSEKFLYNSVVHFVQCRDFESTQQICDILFRGYKRIGRHTDVFDAARGHTCSSYRDFLMLYRVGNYLMLFLYVFGGTIFFVTLLNLYNSINYSVQVRQRYLGMMRAIGAKKSVLPRLYFVEILLIFGRGLPWAAGFGGLLSLGIKLGVDLAFSSAETLFSVAIRLRFGFFFAALGIALSVMFLVTFVFSRIAGRRVTHASVVDILSVES